MAKTGKNSLPTILKSKNGQKRKRTKRQQNQELGDYLNIIYLTGDFQGKFTNNIIAIDVQIIVCRRAGSSSAY